MATAFSDVTKSPFRVLLTTPRWLAGSRSVAERQWTARVAFPSRLQTQNLAIVEKPVAGHAGTLIHGVRLSLQH